MKKGNMLKNTGWLIAGSIARMIIQLIIGAISARYLGPQNYGVLNYVNAYISLFSIICELGLTITIVNEILHNKDREGILVGSAIFVRLMTSLISVLVLMTIIFITDKGDKYVLGVAAIRSLSLIFDSVNTITYWYQSKLQSKYTTLFELLAYAISSIYKVIILIFQKDIFWFAAATTIDSCIIAILLLCGFKKHSNQKLGVSISTCSHLLKIGLPFIFSGIMVYVYGQTDRIMIGKMISQEAVGFYSCASTIGTLIGFLPQAIMNSSKSVIMEQSKKDYKLFEKRTTQTIAAVLWTMILYAVFVTVFGKIIVNILYGEQYFGALSALKVLIWSYGLSYVGTIRNVWLICENKRPYATLFSSIGAAANIVLNLILIPIYGIVGAAIATVSTQLLTTFIAPFLIQPTRRFSLLFIKGLILKDVDVGKAIQYIHNKILILNSRK